MRLKIRRRQPTSSLHRYKCFCKKCVIENTIKSNKRTPIEAYNNICLALPGSYFSFEKIKTTYTGNRNNVIITCNKHDVDIPIPYNTLYGKINNQFSLMKLCPECIKESNKVFSHYSGENEVISALISNGVDWNDIETQYYIPIYKNNITYIKIDFFIRSKNTFIEFNGEQHYKFIERFHKSYQDFIDQVNRDNWLRGYCNENNIHLIQIPWIDIKRVSNIIIDYLNNNRDTTSNVNPEMLPALIY